MANYRILGAMMLTIGSPFSQAADARQQIPPGYYQVAMQERVPAEALYSLALTESSKKLPHGIRPWPWTLNVAGKGYRYATRQQAYQALLKFMRRYPLKRIDVGIAQVNLGWNGQHFRSTWEAFDPYINLHAAARILRACYDKKPGSWIAAAGCYHHPAGGKPTRTYQAIVKRHLNQLEPAIGQLASRGVAEPAPGAMP